MIAMKAFFLRIYDIYTFIVRFFKEAFIPPYEYKEVLNQFFEVGIRSISIITLTGFITGLVFTKQSRSSLAEFGATSWLPSLMAIAIIRALAPLVTALIIAGKVGSNIGAELGSMKVTEQIEAMEVSSTNPFKFLVVSRVLATTIIVPVLATFMGVMGMLGAFLNVYSNEQTSLTSFFQAAFVRIDFLDIYLLLFKSTVYGFTIGMTGCFNGYRAEQGTVGVGRAANASVVVSMFLIFVEEMIIVTLVNNYLK
ncbi:MAG TPA: ABC transporter permease [Puia sp.]|jgi:phospholipid/cholesterol/gamma-HCH transport system permease protein|nr:ABC transporter permease [Puia sp.]